MSESRTAAPVTGPPLEPVAGGTAGAVPPAPPCSAVVAGGPADLTAAWSRWLADRAGVPLLPGPADTGPVDTGPVDTGLADTGPDQVLVTGQARPEAGVPDLDVEVSDHVARARGPVLVVHAGERPPAPGVGARVVVGVDGSAASARALALTAALLGGHDRLDAVTVVGNPEWVFLPGHHAVDDEVRTALARAVHAVVGEVPVELHADVDHGGAVAALVRRSRHADLLVVGSHRHHPPGAGAHSVGAACAAAAHCPVLVVH